ncbi:hypothetical protein SAY86_031736 [Trapa natans]|uniref:WAT1-related protein n=1 Tax=Trapa natans TaxID=22666 RepID=A0AAN7LMB9_TRANT|nr:hypothetical protein SAY86_031736 [Trapa natans]
MKGIAGPTVGMVMAECAQVGLMIVSKSVMSKGMSSLIFVLYSNTLAALLLLPVAFLYHRRTQLPSLSFSLVSQFFLLGLLGCLAQVFGYAGINYSSPTLGTAMLNLIPGITFILAVIFRMERLDCRRASTLAKSIGTIVSICGALIVTLYKGAALMTKSSSLSLHSYLLLPVQSNWVIGGLLLVADCVMASAWLILQAVVLKKYPAELIIVFFYCFFVAIQSAIICLYVEGGDSSAWSLKNRMRLISVLYSAIFGSAFQVGVSTWCLHRTGPVFVSMFKPLGIVIAVVGGTVFLGDTFYLGSLIGSCIIVIGFYSVMWGKTKEEKVDPKVGVVQPNSQKVPLLETIIEEI